MQKTAIRERFDYIPTEREYAWGLYVAGTGRRVEPPQAHYQQPERIGSCQWNNGRVLRDYGILYITDGQGSFKSRDSRWHKVRAGDILLLFPGIWHNYLPRPKQAGRSGGFCSTGTSPTSGLCTS